jgi:hypothetical protein
MQKKRTKKEETIPEKIDKINLTKADFNTIKFTHSQLQFFKTIKNNFLTICTGPAGCLTKNEKIHGYIVKSKKMTRNIHEESSNKQDGCNF